MRKVLLVLGWIVGLYLIVRAVVELVGIDYGNPASYANDWGGPSLAGVLAVHCGPGLIAAVLLVASLRSRRGRTPSGVGKVTPREE